MRRLTERDLFLADLVCHALLWGSLLLLVVVLTGCNSTRPPAPPPADVPSAPALDAAARDQQSKAAAAVAAATTANEQNPPGAPQAAVRGELTVAAAHLPAPSDEDRAAALTRANLALSGQLASAQQQWTAATAAADTLRARIAELERTVQAERETAARELARRLSEAEERTRHQVRQAQVAALNRWGAYLTGASLLALGLAAVFGSFAGLRTVGPLAALAFLGGLACFGIAQIVGQPWFMWAVLATVALGFGLCAWWVVAKYRAGVLAEKLAARADKLNGALRAVVPVLDQAYDEADATVRDLLDRTIFSRLSAAMDRQQKQTVHEIRAEKPAA